jgi:hypothetical protein
MEFQVNTNQVILRQQDQVESGEYNVTECNFTFSSEFDGLTKKAVFTGEDGTAYLQTIVDNKCSIPSEILEISQVVEIGVYAYDVENEELVLRYSPEPTQFYIHQGSYKEAQNSTPPTPSEIEQLQAQITTNANDIDTLETDVGNIQGDIANIEAEQVTQNENIQTNTDNISTINGQIVTINADIDNLENTKADKSEIPTKTSDLINDSGFIEDENYVHTDNNFTDEDEAQITTNKNDIYEISKVYDDSYGLVGFTWMVYMKYQNDYELVPNKFDITTLKPFESRVLVRSSMDGLWKPAVFGFRNGYNDNAFYIVGGSCWKQCIPYLNNEHLCGTTNDCDDFYKTWE